jgi:hypothetical protein
MTKNAASKVVEVKEPITEEDKIAQLEARLKDLEAKLIDKDTVISQKDDEINKMKEKEEGWLIVCPNPLYNGTTMGVLFTDGMAFIPKNKVYPRFVLEMPTANVQREMREDRKKYPNGIEELEIIKQSVEVGSSKRLVDFLVGDFKYQAEFYTKDQMDELQTRINKRAQERKEAQLKIDKNATVVERLSVPQRM